MQKLKTCSYVCIHVYIVSSYLPLWRLSVHFLFSVFRKQRLWCVPVLHQSGPWPVESGDPRGGTLRPGDPPWCPGETLRLQTLHPRQRPHSNRKYVPWTFLFWIVITATAAPIVLAARIVSRCRSPSRARPQPGDCTACGGGDGEESQSSDQISIFFQLQ